MSSAPTSIARRVSSRPWQLWLTQTGTIIRMELRRGLFSRRGIWMYLLAYAPVVIIAIHAVVDHHGKLQEDTHVLAGIFQFYYLRLAIFFGCMGIFTRLFRGEMVERSLHYYLLAPVKRELLVIAKFCAGVLTAMFVFGFAVLGAFTLMYLHFGPTGIAYVFDGPGLGQLVAYLGITVLACLGYGALFLALSMVFKNPIVPGIVVLGWEAINPVLPSLMQKLSVIFYLRHLAPVDVPAEGLFALLTVVAEPVPAPVAVLGALCLTAAILVFACFRVRKLEINYSTD
jgi:ABC-type transport system involved in multi-copper enzyme maturation permease subunit